jgi:uncharacterized membrane protein YjfL (UPF0719 family)
MGPLLFSALTSLVLLAILTAIRGAWARRLAAGSEKSSAPSAEPASGEGGSSNSTRGAAQAILQGGDVFAAGLLGPSLVQNCTKGESLAADAFDVATFGFAALVAYALTAYAGTGLLLGGRFADEVRRGNVAVAVASTAHAMAAAVLAARSLTGTSAQALLIALVFFAVAHIVLNGFVLLFRWLSAYDDAEEMLGGNLAAALSYAGVTLALSLFVGRAAEGPFLGWARSLLAFGATLALALVLYPVRQLLVQGLLLGAAPTLAKGRLDVLVGRERNAGVALLEALAYVVTALVVVRGAA